MFYIDTLGLVAYGLLDDGGIGRHRGYALFGKKLSHLPAENEKRDNRTFGRKEVIIADKIMVS